MKVTIGLLSADSFEVELTGESTVAELKDAIFSQQGIHQTAQQLVFGNEHLVLGKTLAGYGVGDGAKILLRIGERIGLRSVADLHDTRWIWCDDGHTPSGTLHFSVDGSHASLYGLRRNQGELKRDQWEVTGEHEVTLWGGMYPNRYASQVLQFNDAVTGFFCSTSQNEDGILENGQRGYLDEIEVSGSDVVTFADVEGLKESFNAIPQRPGWHPALESIAGTEHTLQSVNMDMDVAWLNEHIAGDPEEKRVFHRRQAFSHVRKSRSVGYFKFKVDEHKVRLVFPGTFNSPDEADAPIEH